jgi:hypothetical protein
MGAMRQITFHFAFFLIQHPFDLFRIYWFHFLIRHMILHVTGSFSLPGSGPLCETVFIPDEKTIKEEKEHVPEFRKRDGNEHDFSRQNVDRHHRIIVKPLVVSEISRQERGESNEQNRIIIQRGDDPDPGQKQAAAKEKSHTDQNSQGQDVRNGFGQTP